MEQCQKQESSFRRRQTSIGSIRKNFVTKIFLYLFNMENTDGHEPDTLTEQTAKLVMKRQIVWRNAVGFLLLHLTGLYGLYVSVTSAKILTWIYGKLKTYTLLIGIYLSHC
jgi:uncharacterized membrane protein YqgA involved in biofilm formation